MTDVPFAQDSESRELFELWRSLVDIESGSHEPEGIDAVGELVAERLTAGGFVCRRLGTAASGASHLVAERDGTGDRPLMLLGHLDTVWPVGTIDGNPFRWTEDGVLLGPGVADMKGGLAVMLAGIERAGEASPPLRVVLTADEELGTTTGRADVEAQAAGCSAALVFEAGRAGGAFVDRRRGVGVFTLTVKGRTAHAGNDPERGINAVDELAHQLLALAALRDPDAGVYVMAGVIEGGTARQVIPDHASALIDVRGISRQPFDEVMERIRELEHRTHIPGAEVVVRGGETRPPYGPVEGTDELKELIHRAAEAVGHPLPEYVRGGGGSDGNFTGALGVPTVDGFGPVGRNLCSLEEEADFASGHARAGLVASVLRAYHDRDQAPTS